MSTLHRLKAYFGMVPADELDDYGPDEYDADYDRGYRPDRAGRRPSRWAEEADGAGRSDDYYDDEPETPARRVPPRRNWAAEAPVRGALAMDPAREVAVRSAPEPAAVPEPHPMSRITTLHPHSYHEARIIGEHYREGIPVIMNLTAMDDADARRLVDFAAGLAFALRGSIDKVTTKVFLISPANVDVTAEDKRRIAEGSFLPPHFNRS
ncbi:MAG TPA: cell division protein SepF [Pseudonocardiaceae bacterium]